MQGWGEGYELCCYPSSASLKSAFKISDIGAAAVELLRRRRLGLEEIANGLFAMAPPPSGGDAMIGRETRMLLRHYLEQGLSKAAVARLAGRQLADGASLDRGGAAGPGVGRGAVRYGPRRTQSSELNPYKEIIETRLAGYPDLSAVRLCEEIPSVATNSALCRTPPRRPIATLPGSPVGSCHEPQSNHQHRPETS